jgi:hypothetical protein
LGVIRRTSLILLVLLCGLLVGCSTARNPENAGQLEKPQKPKKPPPTLPDVTGMDGAEAADELESDGYTDVAFDPDPLTDGSGCSVTDQDPVGGTTWDHDSSVTLTLDCRQVDWENQEGDDWDAYTSSYSQGFSDSCGSVFDAVGESVYDEDPTDPYSAPTEYTRADCSLLDSGPQNVPPDVPDDPRGEGYNEGVSEGCQALFDEAGFTLYTSDGGQIDSSGCGTGGGTALPGE